MCGQATKGGGRGCSRVSPGPVPGGPLQGPQRELQPDAHLLPTASGAAAAPDAGAGGLRLALLLRHAGRGPVHPLGLEGLTRGRQKEDTHTHLKTCTHTLRVFVFSCLFSTLEKCDELYYSNIFIYSESNTVWSKGVQTWD